MGFEKNDFQKSRVSLTRYVLKINVLIDTLGNCLMIFFLQSRSRFYQKCLVDVLLFRKQNTNI